MQRATTTGATDPSELRVQGLLHLIRQTHVEHDARIAMSNAIHQAEVVVIGRGDHEIGSRVAQRLSVCGGRLAAVIGPDTRFAVRAPRATNADIDAASAKGVAVIDEGEFDRMVDVYAAHTGKQQVRAAARRAVDANRLASSIRSTALGARRAGPCRPQRMATSRDDAKRRARTRIDCADVGGRARARATRPQRARPQRVDAVSAPAPATRAAGVANRPVRYSAARGVVSERLKERDWKSRRRG